MNVSKRNVTSINWEDLCKFSVDRTTTIIGLWDGAGLGHVHVEGNEIKKDTLCNDVLMKPFSFPSLLHRKVILELRDSNFYLLSMKINYHFSLSSSPSCEMRL